MCPTTGRPSFLLSSRIAKYESRDSPSYTLMQSVPCCFSETTAARASSAVVTEIVNCGLDHESGPSMMGPQATIFGPSCWPWAIASRRGNTSLATPPMLRVPRTPLAMSIFRSRPASRKCECMSHSPGITNLPVPSITLSEVGIVTCFARPTAAMSCPWTRMVMSGCGLPTPGSMMVTCVSARPPDCVRTTLANPNSAQSTNRERKIDLKPWDRITTLDTGREPFVPARDELSCSADCASQKGCSTDPVLPCFASYLKYLSLGGRVTAYPEAGTDALGGATMILPDRRNTH